MTRLLPWITLVLSIFLGWTSLWATDAFLPWDCPEMDTLDHLLSDVGSSGWVRGVGPISETYAIDTLSGREFQDPVMKNWQEDLLTRLKRNTIQAGPFKLRAQIQSDYGFVSSSPTRLLEVQGFTHSLMSGNEGLFLEGGHLGSLGMRVVGGLTRVLSFSVTPILRLSSRDGIFSDHASFFLKEGLLSLHLNDLVIEAGRGSEIWGLGRYGHLLHSAEHEPFSLLRIRSHRPIIPPWFLRYLGPTSFTGFLTLLDEDREFHNARLAGFYFSFLPHSRVELGIGHSVMFGGDGSPSNDPLVFFSETVAEAENIANRNALVSARFRIPSLEIDIYGELMMEDCCPAIFLNPRDVLNLCGVYFPRIDPAGKGDFAIEWVRTNHITYRHSPYRSGWSYKNRMIGHSLGPDAMGIYGIFRFWMTTSLRIKTILAYEIRGRQGYSFGKGDIRDQEPTYEAPEQRHRLEVGLSFKSWNRTQLFVDAGLEHVTAKDYRSHQEEWNASLGLGLRVEL